MNQDNLKFAENKNGDAFGIVCDGMGGHAHGEVASKIAVEKFIELFKKHDFKNLEHSQINRWLRNSVSEILNEMVEHADRNPNTKDMGTTLTAILFTNNHAYVINVEAKGIYVLTTDGVHDYMDKDLTISTLSNPKQKIGVKAELIIEDAKENVSTDNLSILIVEVE
ncbi:hypothetical protein FQR65_LT16470 [Abscondita terminalis]|nr:hypothetical protein FQR65_LT16470 [Abscondita terminalis]